MDSISILYLCLLAAALSAISTVANTAGPRLVEDNCTLASTEDWNTTGISYYCGNLTGALSLVSTCPTTEEEWTNRTIEADCQNGTRYHCLIDNFAKLRHGCLYMEWYKASHCPFYSIETEQLRWIECGVCPQDIYPYNVIYKYQECVTPIEVVHYPDTGNSAVNAVIIISILALIIIIVTILGVRRRQIRDSVFVASISDRLHRARHRRENAERRIKESKAESRRAKREEIV